MESDYKFLNKKAKSCMRLSSFIGITIFLFILGVVRAVLHFRNVMLPDWVDFVFAFIILLCILEIIFAPTIRYKRYKYYIDEEKMIVIEGLWFITKTIAPIERVHQIAIERGPVDRLYGLSKVVATTAGGNVTISFLEDKIAGEIAESLGIRIGTIVKAQRSDKNA
ncbi:PH domain-containing protein [Aminipila terrae]|uniref:PH domain-containing protein n=1 Tax=Aminipila terrae TaxID=2697030 RepID=A0A6P1M9H2_9FIRM|nr:PH domain-containing protein [Aminipila terrae]QHI71379.1 PH domain-containing protein [Aminipila terrae]